MSEYKRLTERDEWGNADIIGVDSGNLQGNLMGNEFNRVTLALNRFADLEDMIISGKLIKSPCEEMYRVIPNTQSNDFNNEPVYRVLQYKIISISIDGSKYLVESAGWQGKQNQHWLNASEFLTKAQAEARLKELKGEE